MQERAWVHKIWGVDFVGPYERIDTQGSAASAMDPRVVPPALSSTPWETYALTVAWVHRQNTLRPHFGNIIEVQFNEWRSGHQHITRGCAWKFYEETDTDISLPDLGSPQEVPNPDSDAPECFQAMDTAVRDCYMDLLVHDSLLHVGYAVVRALEGHFRTFVRCRMYRNRCAMIHEELSAKAINTGKAYATLFQPVSPNDNDTPADPEIGSRAYAISVAHAAVLFLTDILCHILQGFPGIDLVRARMQKLEKLSPFVIGKIYHFGDRTHVDAGSGSPWSPRHTVHDIITWHNNLCTWIALEHVSTNIDMTTNVLTRDPLHRSTGSDGTRTPPFSPRWAHEGSASARIDALFLTCHANAISKSLYNDTEVGYNGAEKITMRTLLTMDDSARSRVPSLDPEYSTIGVGSLHDIAHWKGPPYVLYEIVAITWGRLLEESCAHNKRRSHWNREPFRTLLSHAAIKESIKLPLRVLYEQGREGMEGRVGDSLLGRMFLYYRDQLEAMFDCQLKRSAPQESSDLYESMIEMGPLFLYLRAKASRIYTSAASVVQEYREIVVMNADAERERAGSSSSISIDEEIVETHLAVGFRAAVLNEMVQEISDLFDTIDNKMRTGTDHDGYADPIPIQFSRAVWTMLDCVNCGIGVLASSIQSYVRTSLSNGVALKRAFRPATVTPRLRKTRHRIQSLGTNNARARYQSTRPLTPSGLQTIVIATSDSRSTSASSSPSTKRKPPSPIPISTNNDVSVRARAGFSVPAIVENSPTHVHPGPPPLVSRSRRSSSDPIVYGGIVVSSAWRVSHGAPGPGGLLLSSSPG